MCSSSSCGTDAAPFFYSRYAAGPLLFVQSAYSEQPGGAEVVWSRGIGNAQNFAFWGMIILEGG